jgi:hypothetical protein
VKATIIGICTLADYSVWLKDCQQCPRRMILTMQCGRGGTHPMACAFLGQTMPVPGGAPTLSLTPAWGKGRKFHPDLSLDQALGLCLVTLRYSPRMTPLYRGGRRPHAAFGPLSVAYNHWGIRFRRWQQRRSPTRWQLHHRRQKLAGLAVVDLSC